MLESLIDQTEIARALTQLEGSGPQVDPFAGVAVRLPLFVGYNKRHRGLRCQDARCFATCYIFFAATSAALISGYAVGGAVSSGCVPICAVKIESIVILF